MNKVILTGRLGGDPETKYTQGGVAVTNFSVATTERWKDSNGERQEHTEWHNVVAFRGLAELCGEYLRKGRQVMVEGKLKTDKFDKDGQTHYRTKVIADGVEFLGDSGERRESTNGAAPPRQSSQQPRTGASQPQPAPDFVDDDIPF